MDNLTPNPAPEETPNPPDSLIARIIQAIIVATIWIVFMGTITGVLGFGILSLLAVLLEPLHNLLNIGNFDLFSYAIIAWLVWMPILWIKKFMEILSEERGK